MSKIKGNALDLWSAGQPFSLSAAGAYEIQLDTMLSIVAGSLAITSGSITGSLIDSNTITATNIDVATITATEIDLTLFTGDDLHFTAVDATPISIVVSNKLSSDGSVAWTGDQDADGFKLTNLGTPTASADATTVGYVSTAVKSGYYHLGPVDTHQLQPAGDEWVRAGACLYLAGLPSVADTFTVQGLTFTFVAGAPATATEIQIGGTVSATAANIVSELNSCASLTLSGTAFNAEFVVYDVDPYITLVVVSEDPPNTPSDGNSRTLTTSTANLDIMWNFMGGVTLEDSYYGAVLCAIDSELMYYYTKDLGWRILTGFGGVDAYVRIDLSSTPDYLGANFNDGVLRVDSTLSYTDGGDFITLAVDTTQLDHTQLINSGAISHASIDTHIGDVTLHFTEASIDHVNISSVGSNSHFQIDTHISDATLHFTMPGIDDLTDTTITSVSSADRLEYNGSAWVNVSPNYLSTLITGANYTILDDDQIAKLLVDPDGTDRDIYLPTAADNSGRDIYIKNVNTNVVTVHGEGAETIDGAATLDLTVQYTSYLLHCDGSNWHIL